MSFNGRKKGGTGLFSPAQLSKVHVAAARSFLSSGALPQLADSGSKRFGLGEAPSQADGIKAVRPRQSTPGPRADSPGSSLPPSTAASIPSVTGAALEAAQVHLLGKALEESRVKVQSLTWEKQETAEKVAEILEALAAIAPVSGALGSRAGSPRPEGMQEEEEEEAPLDRVHAHVRRLQKLVQVKEVEIAEMKLRHEDAATAVLVKQQELERKDTLIEEQRLSMRHLEEAQHGMQLKIELLESQAVEQAASARRRMEEQTSSLKEEAAAARVYQERCTNAEKQLEVSQRAVVVEKERGNELAEQIKRLEGQLLEAQAKIVEGEKKLWDSEVAYHDLKGEHHAIIERNKALVIANRELQAAVADHKEGALLAATLKQALEAQRVASEQLQAAMQEEIDKLGQELREERERKIQSEAARREAQLAAQALQAAGQGRQDEIASLLLKLDEYTNRLAKLETDIDTAAKREAVVLGLNKEAEAEASKMRKENASLRDSLAEMAAEESRLKHSLQETQAQLVQTDRRQREDATRCRRLEGAMEIRDEHIRLLQETLLEQAQLTEGLGQTQERCEKQEERIQQLELALTEAEERCGQLRQAISEAAAAKDAAEKMAYKQSVINKNLREQQTALATKLKANEQELVEALRAVTQLQQQATNDKAIFASRGQELEQARLRISELEHMSRQQCSLITDLEQRRVAVLEQLSAVQQQRTHLHTLGWAYSQAYGRLLAHASGLQEQFARQLGALLQLCRHLALQLGAPGTEPQSQTEALAASDMPASTRGSGSGTGDAPTGGSSSTGDAPSASEPDSKGAEGEDAAAKSGSGSASAAGRSESRSATAGVQSESSSAPAVHWRPTLQLLDTLRTELHIAIHMLEAQSGSAEAALLAEVPAEVAAALQEDLRSVPYSVLMHAQAVSLSEGELQPGVEDSTQQEQQEARVAAAKAGPADGVSALPPGALLMSEQVAQMEAQLERLLHDKIELKVKAAAAVEMHGKELAARQHAQRVVARLREELKAIQAKHDSLKGQRDLHERFSRELARKLRDAANAVRNLEGKLQEVTAVDAEKAEQAGTTQPLRPPAVSGSAASQPNFSMSYRGLLHRATQTQHCDLWERNVMASAPAPATAEGVVAAGTAVAGAEEATRAAGRQAGGEVAGEGPDPASTRVLSLGETQQLIQAIYRQKALADLAVARGRQPFASLPAYLESYFQVQLGAGMEAAGQRLWQLAASVRHHAFAEHEVALFGLAAGLLQEEDLEEGEGGSRQQRQQQRRAGSLGSSTSQQAAAAAQLLLHRTRRLDPDSEREASLDHLRSFCHSCWHQAYLRSSSRKLEAAPNPMQFLHSICADVHDLALSVPGVSDLLRWVNEGGLAGSLASMDLGLAVAENQVPQLYLLAVDAYRLLGISGTPRIYVKNSPQAAAFYLQLPAQPKAFHGLNGAVAGAAVEPQRAGSQGPRAMLEAAEAAAAAAKGAAEGDWECGLVLTSALVDLLEPLELQAVMVGQALGFHAALSSKAGGAFGAAAAGAAALAGSASAGQPDASGGPQAGAGPGAGGAAALCRALASIHTLGSLCALCPEVVAQRLPPQMAPLFVARLQPVLLRASRYLALFGDRFSLAVAGEVRTVASALVKLATGSSVLRNELNLDAVLQQAESLDDAAMQLLPAALRQDDGNAMGAASSSLTILRIWNLMRNAPS